MAGFTGYKTASMEGDFVVFLIGMRINHYWKTWKWLPVASAMPRMLKELGKNPDLGLLHATNLMGYRTFMNVQYWRSWDHLHDYASNKDHEHLPAWRAFNKAVAGNGDVGVWHETYLVSDGRYENLYVNMPPYGLGAVGELEEPTGEKRWAKGRLGKS